MLYGNLIFIKKTGGDGSKFPVTEKDIKIGTAEDCLIRIYNQHVQSEHCHLIIENNGRATLRNMSKNTVLNGKPVDEGDIALHHGDVLKIGARSARWEYLPSSTNYRPILSPSGAAGRLVAVVMPQQRSLGDQSTPGTSASQGPTLKSTPLWKRSHSERSSESSSAVKMRKSSGSDLISNNRGDLLKLLTGRHSLKTPKLQLHKAKLNDRKSISGMSSTKSVGKAKEKSRKSTLPSWKVKFVSPSGRKSLESRNSPAKSIRKSTRSPKSEVKTPSKNIMESKSEKLLLSASKKELKTPQRTPAKSKSTVEVINLASQSALKTIVESPSKSEASVRSKRGLSKSPSPQRRPVKTPSKAVLSTPRQKRPKLSMPVHSESKVKSKEFSTGKRKMVLMLHSLTSSGKKSKGIEKSSNIKSSGDLADTIVHASAGTNLLNEPSPVKQKSPKTPKITSVKKTPAKTVRSPRKSPAKNSGQSSVDTVNRTPRKSAIVKTPGSLIHSKSKSSKKTAQTEGAQSTKKGKHSPRKSVSADTPARKTPAKSIKSAEKTPSSTSQKVAVVQAIPSPADLKSSETTKSQGGRKSSAGKTPSRKSGRASASPRGIRRKLSPTSNAERAAKKLKTSRPKKPDKNKKAALLLLGIASRNQLLSQNVKVLLKRKIVKKAIKQSTAAAPVKGASKKTAPKASRKKISKPTKKSLKAVKSSPPQSSASPATHTAKEKNPTGTPKGKKVLETGQLNSSTQQTSPLEKSPSKQNKKAETGLSILSKSYSSENPSPSYSFEKSPENYLFASNRRCSKRLSSKNETDRPDFIELCPTALGLIPKIVETFKTPKVTKRRSLATPKNLQSLGIIKSASTSKIGSRKSVRFSSKEESINSEMSTPNGGEITRYDFTPFQTPNITVDAFVSPLTDKSSVTKKDLNDSTFKAGEIYKISNKTRRSNSEPATCVRKLLQSPQAEENSEKVSSSQKTLLRSSRITASQSPSPAKVVSQAKRASHGDLIDFEGECLPLTTPKTQKSPKNNLSDLKGVARLLRTPKDAKSPKNDLTDVKGVKKLFQTPKAQKSPKNDLTDVKGVKRLLKTPKTQKSPKNDLSDVRGVKKLLATPKVRKSPKNDLSDLRGVKKLMQSPKVQKSPKNDLSDVRGVKQLMRTPQVRKSPRNELSDLRGVKNLLGSPKVQNSPKNDLSDLTGVKKLFTTPRARKSPKNNLLDVSGVGKLFESPVIQKLSTKSASGTTELKESLKSKETLNEDLKNVTAVKQLLISESPETGSKSKKGGSRKSHVNDFRAIRGRRTIYSTPKGPKNDLSDPSGLRELFCRHKPICNFDMNLTGVAELFELPKPEATTTQKSVDSSEKTVSEVKRQKSRAVRSRGVLEIGSEKEEKITTRSGRLRTAAAEKPEKKATRSKKPVEEATSKEKKPTKRKATEETKTTQAKKPVIEEQVKPSTRTRTKTETENNAEGVKSSRKRKAQDESSETSPPKLRRRKAVDKSSSAAESGSSKSTRSEAGSKKTVAVKSVKKAPSKVQSKTVTKTGTKKVQKVQKVQSRSQTSSKKVSDSEEKISPRKTRSTKTKASAQSKVSKSGSVDKKVAKTTTTGRKKDSPVVTRSTRRK